MKQLEWPSPPFHKIVEQTSTVGDYNGEKPILIPCWICFFDFTFVFVIIIIHNGLPQGTLLLCLTVKLKWLCSVHRETIWPYPPVNGCRKDEFNTSSPILQDKWPFYFMSSPSLFLCSTNETGIQTLIIWVFWRHYFAIFSVYGFPIHILCLSSSVFSLSACCVVEQNELGLGNR